MTNWSTASASTSRRADGAPLDAHLVSRALDGDEPAFRALYERHAPMVHAVLLSHAPRGEADDLMQEVFLAAWRALHTLRDGAHAGAWLATIARNAAHRGREQAARRDAAPLEHEPADPRAGADGRADVLSVLLTLPAAYRETLAMRLVEGLTGPQIAEATGLTHGSVRVNLSRGMKLLQDALRKEGWP